MELLVYVRWSLGRARTPITLTQLPWNRRTSLEKTFPAEVSWKLVRDEGRERVLTIRGLLRFHWNDRLGSARRFSDTFVRKARGKRWASSYEYGGRNKRSKKHRLAFGSPGFSSFPFDGHCTDDARNASSLVAMNTSWRKNARTPDDSKVEKFHDGRWIAGQVGWRENDRRIESLSNRKIENTRADGRAGSRWTDVSLEKSAVRNGRRVGMPVHRKNLLRPIPPVLEQSAIHHRTTAVPSSYCAKDEGTNRRFFPFVRLSLSGARGWQTWLSIASFEGKDISTRISSLTNAFVRKF